MKRSRNPYHLDKFGRLIFYGYAHFNDKNIIPHEKQFSAHNDSTIAHDGSEGSVDELNDAQLDIVAMKLDSPPKNKKPPKKKYCRFI